MDGPAPAEPVERRETVPATPLPGGSADAPVRPSETKSLNSSSRACRTCGAALAGPRAGAPHNLFCGSTCRSRMHNLRMRRGEQVYDLLMTRASSYRNRHLIADIDRMARAWLKEDRAAGRVTHKSSACTAGAGVK